MKNLLISILLLVSASSVFAQTGITVGPPRTYFVAGPGQQQTQRISISNPSKDYTMELAVSFEDWQYSTYGDNQTFPKGSLATSCAAWLSTPEIYFSLKPEETKMINVNISVPKDYIALDTVPVRTAMMFVTQMNPKTGVNKEGANIRIALRSGIKLYQALPGKNNADIEIEGLKYNKGELQTLELNFSNTGNIWADGQIAVELLNQENGKKTELPSSNFFTMPRDKRIFPIPLPKELENGTYLASVLISYGEKDAVKIGELEFNYEKSN